MIEKAKIRDAKLKEEAILRAEKFESKLASALMPKVRKVKEEVKKADDNAI